MDAVDIYRGLELISLKPEVVQNICCYQFRSAVVVVVSARPIFS